MARNLYLALFLFVLYVFSSSLIAKADIDVTKYGAKSGGSITGALSKAWDEACKSPGNQKILIPKGEYVTGPLILQGPCKGPIQIQCAGNIKAPADPAAFKGYDATILIQKVQHLTLSGVSGGGIFDGQGQIAWKKNNCAATGTCNSLPFNFRFNFIEHSVIDGISSLNSKQFHMNVLGCNNLTLQNMKIFAPPESLNTDGIHIGRSQNIKIINVDINTGDDCVSIGDDTKRLTVEKVTCGRGHGISIGSLGRYQNEGNVEGIIVNNCTIKNAQNGVRVKTWLNSYPGVGSGFHFSNIVVENVDNPIIVDQAYCPYNHCQKKIPSKVKLEDISFKDVRGTASSPCVIKLVCSSGYPCQKVVLQDIDLKFKGSAPAISECCNVKPILGGKINPPACTKKPAEAASA